MGDFPVLDDYYPHTGIVFNHDLFLGTGALTAASLAAGTLAADQTGAAAAVAAFIKGDAAQNRDVAFQTGSLTRWLVRCDSTAEGGSDAGSDLSIISRTDAGAAKTTVLKITRSSGLITLGTGVNLTATGSITAGAMTISTAAAGALLAITASAAQNRDVALQTAGSTRWIIRCDSTAEGGSDAGSDFNILSRTDAGGAKTNVLQIVRSSGLIILGGELATKASTTTTAGLRLAHGTAPTSPVNGQMWTTTAGLFVQINGVTKTVTLT